MSTTGVISAHPLADAFPKLSGQQLADLARDIAANGQKEPITLLDGAILDGRSRYEACRMAEIAPRFREYEGDTAWTTLQAFCISLNVKRRHLTEGQLAAVAAKLATMGQGTRTDLRPSADPPKVVVSQEQAAASVGTSPRRIGQYKRVEREAPDLIPAVEAGELALDRAERITRDRQAAQKSSERTRREASVTDLPIPDIRHGHFPNALSGVHGVDLVLTDPPYPREYLPLWSDLSLWARKVLKPGSLLVAYSGQYHLPEVMTRLSEHLDYLWLGWLSTLGPNVSVHQRPVMSAGKPLLFFSAGPLSPTARTRRFVDVVSSEHRTRDEHIWEQAQGPAAYLLDALTERGEFVADPFIGSGTFATVAVSMGRRFVGCDIDEAAVQTTRNRLAVSA